MWPISIAPWQVYLCGLRLDDEKVKTEAQKLYDQMVRTFTKGSAQKRYAIRVVNTLLKDNKFSKEEVMLCLKTIPANEVFAAELMDCGIREACIASVLTAWLIKIKRGEVTLAA